MVTVKTGKDITPENAEKPLEAPRTHSMNSEVEFTTPSGMKIKLGKPGFPVKLLMPTLMAAAQPNAMSAFSLENIVRQVLYVREVNDKPVPVVQEYKDVAAIIAMLGDEGMDAVEIMHSKYFPALTEAQLQVIKK